MTNVLLRLVRRARGEQAVAAVLERAGCPHDAPYLEDIENWISVEEACALLQAAVEETGDELFARRIGEETLRQHAGTQVATMLRSLGSPEAVLQVVAMTAPKFGTVTLMEAIETRPGHALVTAAAREGFTRNALQCDWTRGMLSMAPALFGLPAAQVHESECQARGGAECRYTVSWDPQLAATAADPQEHVTALEAQIVEMSERLQNAYATASDLISAEDLATVLQRIVDRAANAVRAPSYVLAIRTEPDSELQVFGHGIDHDAAQALAGEVLERGADRDCALVVGVTSSRRDYGELIALYPGPVQFFPQDREMLSLYAKHAAAVLDMATALDESARRHAQVSSLLSLAHALAQAGTSEEVAERIAAAVPEVVDCDGTAVWLWNEHERELRSLAAWASRPGHADFLRDLTLTADSTPHMARMITAPQPMFFAADTADEFVKGLLTHLDLAAIAVVPIVARSTFRGVLSVSVNERPERLLPDSELLEQLTGVAALAAPAIQNGRLVDQLRHKASHDGLTGLLNRVGFRAQIDAVMSRAEQGHERAGLLFVDLDNFKGVNDEHGHETGDELLSQVAGRLSAVGRGDDHVARLGGDEFAIILAGVSRADQLDAAAQRVREAFLEPFSLGRATVAVRASVGGGIWPDDGATVAELVRHADGEMYREKARQRPGVAARA